MGSRLNKHPRPCWILRSQGTQWWHLSKLTVKLKYKTKAWYLHQQKKEHKVCYKQRDRKTIMTLQASSETQHINIPLTDRASHGSEWIPSVTCPRSGLQDDGHCHGGQGKLNRPHRHEASVAENWTQAWNFCILPGEWEKNDPSEVNSNATVHSTPKMEVHEGKWLLFLAAQLVGL